MPEDQKPELSVVTNIEDQIAKRQKQNQIEQRKKFVKNFAIGAVIGYIVVTAIRAVAYANSFDDTEEETDD